MINSNVTTLTLNGAETAVQFSTGYPYFQITNKGDSDIFVSLMPNVSPETDGTYTIAAGETARIGEGYRFDTFYILGTGKAYIRGEQTAFPTSFKQGVKGGDSGGGSEYTLPVASVSALGGVKSGGDITVSSEGAVTVNSVGGKTVKADVPADAKFTDTVYTLPTATAETLGGVKPDGTTLSVDANGVLSAQKAIDSIEIGAKLVTQIAHPNNYLIYDDVGKPSVMVAIPKFYFDEVIDGAEHIVHPAFMVNGVEQNAIYISKYQNIVENDRAYSLPMKDPAVNINFDRSWSYCKNKGTGWHLMTNAEWAAIALWCRKNGTIPKGNNNYGKDISEENLPPKAIPASVGSDGKTNRVLTGSGRKSWYHDNTFGGIADLNGNIWEWISGIRLVSGELQVIPYNNVASGKYDLSANSTDWKAINANTTSWDDLFIIPDGSGTTENSVKLDYVSGHWEWTTTITNQANSGRGAVFATTTFTGDNIAKLYLQAMTLLPEDSATSDTYGGGYIYANNGAAERYVFRGSNWTSGVGAGIFHFNFGYPRSHSFGGGRSAYVNTTAQPLAATLELSDSLQTIDGVENAEMTSIEETADI